MTSFHGFVRDAGGGEVIIVVDRDTLEYPALGQSVLVVASSAPRASSPTSRDALDGAACLATRRTPTSPGPPRMGRSLS